MGSKAQTRFLAKDGIFCVLPSGEITAWGTFAIEMLGYSAEEAIGNYCFNLLGRGKSYGKPCFPKCPVLGNARKNRSSRDFRATWKRKNDELLSVDVSTIIRDSKETGKELIHIFKENTTERTLSEAARQALSEGEGLNGVKLTPRECQTLRLAAGGLTTAEIAAKLNIARVTARNHIILAMDKLCASNRTHAVVKALAAKML